MLTDIELMVWYCHQRLHETYQTNRSFRPVLHFERRQCQTPYLRTTSKSRFLGEEQDEHPSSISRSLGWVAHHLGFHRLCYRGRLEKVARARSSFVCRGRQGRRHRLCLG